MLRWIFIVVYLILGGYLVGAGMAAYRLPDAALDAGVAAMFCSFWFFFGAAGVYLRHVWLVTIANMTLGGVALLFLFLAGVDLYARGGGDAPLAWASPRAAAGLCGFLLAAQIYAVIAARREARRPGQESAANPAGRKGTDENT